MKLHFIILKSLSLFRIVKDTHQANNRLVTNKYQANNKRVVSKSERFPIRARTVLHFFGKQLNQSREF